MDEIIPETYDITPPWEKISVKIPDPYAGGQLCPKTCQHCGRILYKIGNDTVCPKCDFGPF